MPITHSKHSAAATPGRDYTLLLAGTSLTLVEHMARVGGVTPEEVLSELLADTLRRLQLAAWAAKEAQTAGGKVEDVSAAFQKEWLSGAMLEHIAVTAASDSDDTAE